MSTTTQSIIAALSVVLLTLPNIALAHYNKRLCSDPEYTCVKVRHGDSWDKLFPDPEKQDIVKKINRMNIPLSPGITLALPNHLREGDPLMYAPFPIRIAPFNRTLVLVDLEIGAFAAYNSFGSLVHWGPISAGRDWCPDVGRGCHTPVGTYYVQSKGGPDCHSSKYPIPNGGAPMPYCMYFRGGYALHASAEVPGYNASHGCVRLFYEDARWLNKDFIELGKNSTEVIIR